MSDLGKLLILFGVILVGLGLLLTLAGKIPWLGRLPGDIAIRRDHFSLYFPLTSCLLASIVISVILWIVGRFQR